MYLNSTPLEIYLVLVFAMAAIGTLLALWAIASIVVQGLHHRRNKHCTGVRRAWGSPYRPRAAAHELDPLLH
jgi:hypothetical protein